MPALAAFLCAVVCPAAHADADSRVLAARVAPIVAEHQGRIAVAVRDLRGGTAFTHNADDPMPTASLIKLAVLVDLYAQAHEGKLSLDKRLTLTQADCVPGAGVLTDSFTPGASLTLRDAARLMITVSDNTATNLVLGQTTIPAPNASMTALGFPNTRVNALVYKGSTTSVDPARTKKYGLGSTTAREMVGLLAKLDADTVVTPAACREMLGILRKNHDSEMLVRLLPDGTAVAHKTGAVSDARTDAGIVYVRGKPAVAVCVLTCENADKRWVVDNAAQLVIARVGRAVYDHFAARAPAPTPAKK